MLRLGYRKLSYLFLILSALMYAFIMMPEKEVVEVEPIRMAESIKEEEVFERLSSEELISLRLTETGYRADFNSEGENLYRILSILGSFKREVEVESLEFNSSNATIMLKFKFLKS